MTSLTSKALKSLWISPIYNEITFFFVLALKRVLLRYRLDFFLKDPANFSPLPGFGKNFSTRPEGSGKIKNVNLIKIRKKRNGAKRKWRTSFFVCHLLNLNLVPIDSELNSALGYQTYFYQIYGRGTQKSTQT